MSLFETLFSWLKPPAPDEPDDPPVPFGPGGMGHRIPAKQVFETFCRTVACLEVERQDALRGGRSDAMQVSRALALVTSQLDQNPDSQNPWAVARENGQLAPPDPERWELREQHALALGWALDLERPLVPDLLEELDALPRQSWDETYGIVDTEPRIQELATTVLGWSRESIAAAHPTLRSAEVLVEGIARLDQEIRALTVRAGANVDHWHRLARAEARQDALRWVLEGNGALDATPMVRWRARCASAAASTGWMLAPDWVHHLVGSVGPLPEGVDPVPSARQRIARDHGYQDLLDVDAAGAPALAWALQLADEEASIESWLPGDPLTLERLAAQAELRDADALKARRRKLRKQDPDGAAVLDLVLQKEPRPRATSRKVRDEEHQTSHVIDGSTGRYRSQAVFAEAPEDEPMAVPERIQLGGERVIEVRAALEGPEGGPDWGRGLRPVGDGFFLQVDGPAVRVWKVDATSIVKVADSLDDWAAQQETPRPAGSARVRRRSLWHHVTFAGPGPIVLELASVADLVPQLDHEDAGLAGTTLVVPAP